MELKIGDKYRIFLDYEEVEAKAIDVEIVKMLPRELEFTVTGDGVSDPEKPRKMNPVTFARWLKGNVYQKV
jgi:hypothetical protein